MKKCPTCEKTFDDNLRFCQNDGTPLVEVAVEVEPPDPYKTMVASQEDLISAIPPDPFKTSVASQANKEDDLLQLPEEHDPQKTMYVSEDELRKEMSSGAPKKSDEPKEDLIDLSPPPSPFGNAGFADAGKIGSQNEPPPPPKFNEPNLNPPSFGDVPPPDFSSGEKINKDFGQSSVPEPTPIAPPKFDPPKPLDSYGDSSFNKPTGPIPSPFNDAKPASYEAPSTPLPTYGEPEPIVNEPIFEEPSKPFAPPSPFGQTAEPFNQQMAQSEWAPPPAPDANWQNQPIGQNTPFQPPVAGTSGQNNTLAIVSLVLGLLSIPCCAFVVFGIGAAVTGFIAKKKADENPNEYGGRGMAMAGLIIGVITAVLGLVLTILQIFFGVLGSLANAG